MKRTKNGLLILLMCSILLGIFCVSGAAEPAAHPRKIVVFDETFVNEAAQIALVRRFGGVAIKSLPVINAMAVYLPPEAIEALSKTAGVLRIDDDVVVNAIGKPKPPQPAEVLPWGVDRINADSVWATTTGLAVKVGILDTGIDLSHPDLQANIKQNVNTISPFKSGNDDNGHGTHVAGIVAAIDNEIGVIGVGPEIYLYAVKVLDRNGSGWLSDLIEGLQWCINNGVQVVNMSLGSSSDNQSFHDAIIKTYQTGIIQVAAAGNNGGSGGAITYPAKYPETIAVSAINKNDQFASFSSYGSEIDLTAPGVDIYSTYKGSTYKTLSGTSMAAPHVTGTAALVISRPIVGTTYDLDGDGIWDPVEVENKLEDTAEWLTGLSVEQQGAGLVRADLAIQ